MSVTNEEKSATHAVPHELFRGLLVCAVRYALPRHTYVVSEAEDWITQLAHELHARDLEVIKRDIEQALREDQSRYRSLHDCDRHMWQKMLAFVDNLLRERQESQ